MEIIGKYSKAQCLGWRKFKQKVAKQGIMALDPPPFQYLPSPHHRQLIADNNFMKSYFEESASESASFQRMK